MKQLEKDSFNRYLEDNIRKVVEKYQLLEPDEKIAVALSGGKDSILTLHILNKLKRDFNFELVAISIDEGISSYRDEGLKVAEKHATELGVDLIKKSFKEEFGFKIDDVSAIYKSACIPCGVFRRYLLNKTTHQIGANKIATGHNLDDEIQSFLMSFARADFKRFTKFGPKLDTIHQKLIPRIKPLWNVTEKEVGIWAIMKNVEVHLAECPYAYMSLRSKMKDFLNKMEDERPGTKVAIMESFKKTFKTDKTTIPKLNECERCGEPSSLNVCKACEMLIEINKHI